MNIGWVEKTVLGVRLYESRIGRFFRDVASARSRDSVVQVHGTGQGMCQPSS